MLTDSRAHVWTGPLDANQIIEKFATGKRYMEYRQHGLERGDYRLYHLVEDGR